MVMEKLYEGSVNSISSLIASCQFSLATFVLLEMLPHKVIDNSERQNLLYFAHFDHTLDFENYTSGRIFQNDFELRWSRGDNDTQVIYLGIDRSLPTLQIDNEVDLKQCASQLKSYYLFGKRLKSAQLNMIGSPAIASDFAEVRIPRLLRYPAPKKAQRVQLVIKEYIHKQTRELVLFRFQDLIAAEEAV